MPIIGLPITDPFCCCVDCLIDVEHDENEKTTKFSNYLRLGLQSNEPAVIIPASKALGTE